MPLRKPTPAPAIVMVLCLVACSKAEVPDGNSLEDALRSGTLDVRAAEECQASVGFDFAAELAAAVDSTAGGVRNLREEVDVFSSTFDEGLPRDDDAYAAICIYEFAPGNIDDNTVGVMWVSSDERGGGQGIVAFW